MWRKAPGCRGGHLGSQLLHIQPLFLDVFGSAFSGGLRQWMWKLFLHTSHLAMRSGASVESHSLQLQYRHTPARAHALMALTSHPARWRGGGGYAFGHYSRGRYLPSIGHDTRIAARMAEEALAEEALAEAALAEEALARLLQRCRLQASKPQSAIGHIPLNATVRSTSTCLRAPGMSGATSRLLRNRPAQAVREGCNGPGGW